ncbi:MAG TPA: thiamine-phosphate kinase [Phycisphaerales bacterium]|nr:thiamine-phosphate kinase [Phycisphaerales bacterium]
MREQALLAHIAATTPPHPIALVGPGDDCAVVATPSSASLLVTTDQVIEGRHFRAGEDLTLVARKAVCRSLSDIAAMGGGSERWAVATGALPRGMSEQEAKRLTDALHAVANSFHCPIVGGDIAATDGPMVLTVTVAAAPHPVRGPVLRSTAQINDVVYVTGALGGSLPSRRHLTFTPRLAEAAWLATLLGPSLHAMMDVSDGVGIDASRLARASHVAVTLDAALLPRHEHVPNWQSAAGDGEDYELLFTAPSGSPVPSRCPHTGTAVTAIGRVTSPSAAGPACVIIDPDGVHHDAGAFGWEHRS